MIVKINLGYTYMIIDMPKELLYVLPEYSTSISLSELIDLKIYYEQNEVVFIINSNGLILKERCNVNCAAFKLLVEIEQCFCEKIEKLFPNSIFFHGGLITVNNKSVMLIGKKTVGKSTLISLLTKEKEVKYLSDDIVVANGLELFGAIIPQRLRYLFDEVEEKVIGQGLDFSGEIRYFYLPEQFEIQSVVSNIVIIPIYNRDSNQCYEVVGYKKMLILCEHIRSVSGIRDVFFLVGELSKHIKMYMVMYNNNIWVKNKIYELISKNNN